MAAITISRQLGSLDAEVTQAIARRLGWRVVCREIINRAALQAGAPEMALATIDDLGLLGLHPSPEARQAYKTAVSAIVVQLANDGGVVIVGRAGQAILRRRPDVLHVRLMASFAARALRVARQQQILLTAAAAQVEASDRSRRAYLRTYYHLRWDDDALYDLVINTERLPADAAAELICRALDGLVQASDQRARQAEERP
jgi:cytidylate kinase